MLATLEADSTPRRRALRRSVEIECATHSAFWDDAAPFLATDLSPYGLWLRTELPLEVGAQITLSFRPPQWPVWASPITTRAEVVRVSMPRRRRDQGNAGMGLCFVDLDGIDAACMSESLRGLPPPLPKPLAQPLAVAVLGTMEQNEIDLVVDGVRFELCAEAALLTCGSGRKSSPKASKSAYKLARARHRATRRVGLRGKRSKTAAAAPKKTRRPQLRLVS